MPIANNEQIAALPSTTLRDLPLGRAAIIASVGGEGSLRQHFLDMGLIPQTQVTAVKYAPMGDPLQIRLHGYELTLRLADAEKIVVKPLPCASADAAQAHESQLGSGGANASDSNEDEGVSRLASFAHPANAVCAAATDSANRLTQPESTDDRAYRIMNLGHDCSSCTSCDACGLRPDLSENATSTAAATLAKRGRFPGGHPHEREHPGFGEGGRFHSKEEEQPLPEGTKLRFALAGNQNCGKTTLFNAITGSNQHVGNFPGVTVDRKDGMVGKHENTQVTDLPGIYSMSPYSSEELVTRDFLLKESPHGIINIVDATNIERNLYLTMQLLELDIPMVLALNMMDEVYANGGTILVNELESQLGIPVVPISAIRNEGTEELIEHALHVAQYQERPQRQDFCAQDENGGAVHRCLHGIMHLVEDHAQRAGIPLRFAASKLAEGDPLIADQLQLDQNERETLEHLILQMEHERGLDRAAAIADMRFSFIKRVCAATVVKPRMSKGSIRSAKIDQILTGKFTAIPAFVAIMLTVFYLTFNVFGAWLQELLEAGITALGDIVATGMEAAGVNPTVQSLVIDGIFGGVGSVLSFLPIIVVLFFFLSLLEDSGYMARVAFFMDKLLRKMGLSGRSIVPMIIGFGCSVPAVMASRTLPSERDRKMTVLLTPFMSCSAKLPIYAFLTAAFFPSHGALVMGGLYFFGIAVGVLCALLLKGTLFKGEAVPFVMELPNYRMPGAKNVAHLLWDKTWDFLSRAFTVIFVATIIIWFLQTFDPSLHVVDDSQQSILALLAGWMAPLLAPFGLGDWRISTALLSGFMAKESVVSILSMLYGSTAALTAAITPLAALSLLVFCLLYTPCVAAVASVKRELGWPWAIFMVVFQCIVAWLCAYGVYAIGMMLGFA